MQFYLIISEKRYIIFGTFCKNRYMCEIPEIRRIGNNLKKKSIVLFMKR